MLYRIPVKIAFDGVRLVVASVKTIAPKLPSVLFFVRVTNRELVAACLIIPATNQELDADCLHGIRGSFEETQHGQDRDHRATAGDLIVALHRRSILSRLRRCFTLRSLPRAEKL